MRGLVILEGPDACGKTTLANKMVELWGGKYIHLIYVPGKRAMYAAQKKALKDAARELEKGNFVVIDRHWISENIYSDVYRGGSKLSLEAQIMNRRIQKLRGVYVLCCPMNVKLAVRWHKETSKTGREMYKPSSEIKRIAEYYKWLWTGAPKSFIEMGIDYMSYAADIVERGGVQYRDNWLLYDRRKWAGKKGMTMFCKKLAELLETLK